MRCSRLLLLLLHLVFAAGAQAQSSESVIEDGYLYANDQPGLGIDIDEDLAAKYPCGDIVEQWTQTRLPDGSPTRP